MGFPRQEYWSGLPWPSPGDLPNPRIEPGSPALQADALPSEVLKENVQVLPLVKNKKKPEIFGLTVEKPMRNILVVVQWDAFTQCSKRGCKLWGPWSVSERRCYDSQL